MADKPTFMKAEDAGRVLEQSLTDPRTPMTVADAAAKSGLALRDAAQGMHWLTERYRGHLRVTNDGDLIFLFPNGFTRPWVARDRVASAAAAVGRGLAGAGRFVIRAWLMVVMVAYVAAFVAVLIGLMFARSSDDSSDRRSSGGGALVGALLRALADAAFWTFHPWSPLSYGAYGAYGAPAYAPRGREHYNAERDPTPFYEKVNRFVFGPTPPPTDPREMERRLIAQIRAGKGRIGLADVMRVTGLPREQADPLMARLMLDYEGDVSVSEEGGISYRFEALRKSATNEQVRPPPAAWDVAPTALPLTGNSGGTNALITLINGFNLVMGLMAIGAGLTINNVMRLFQGVPLPDLPQDGTAVALGIVPVLFSLAMFLLPAARALMRPSRVARAAREQGRLAVVREVVKHAANERSVPEAALTLAWTRGAGAAPADADLRRVVLDLGGDVEDRDDGQVRYRFTDLTAEARAVEEARAEAPETEARTAAVAFTSER